MRDLRVLNGMRDCSPQVIKYYGGVGDETCGVFRVQSNSQVLICVASADGGWDHVSVSLPNRCPNWPEMDHVKRLFFKDDEVVMQLHVAAADHISHHPYCLHLWRPHDQAIPLPPKEFVA